MDGLSVGIVPPGELPANLSIGTGFIWVIRDVQNKIVAHATVKSDTRMSCEAEFERFKTAFLDSFSDREESPTTE